MKLFASLLHRQLEAHIRVDVTGDRTANNNTRTDIGKLRRVCSTCGLQIFMSAISIFSQVSIVKVFSLCRSMNSSSWQVHAVTQSVHFSSDTRRFPHTGIRWKLKLRSAILHSLVGYSCSTNAVYVRGIQTDRQRSSDIITGYCNTSTGIYVSTNCVVASIS